MIRAVVYLLHFSEPYPGGRRPQHYLGVAHNLEERMQAHLTGSAKSRLTLACREKGILVMLAKVWQHESSKEAFDAEREIKARKKSYSRFCPMCAQEGKEK